MPIRIFLCEHCHEWESGKRSATVKHEKECHFNPEVRGCGGCEHSTLQSYYGPYYCALYGTCFKDGFKVNCKDWKEF